MRAGVMSAGLWGVLAGTKSAEREAVCSPVNTLPPPAKWDPERFAHEQLRGLVRQVFCSSTANSSAAPVRQIVFSAAEPSTDVHSICLEVGQMLALETQHEVAIVGQARSGDAGNCPRKNRVAQLRQAATRVQENLWLVPLLDCHESPGSTISLHSYLGEIRKQFEYSIVEASSAGESNQACALAQFADGMILIVSAQHTRRAVAREIRRTLAAAGVRLLGAVLSDREFPIPEELYRRL